MSNSLYCTFCWKEWMRKDRDREGRGKEGKRGRQERGKGGRNLPKISLDLSDGTETSRNKNILSKNGVLS